MSFRYSFQMWILGNPIKIEGTEFANERAIYISNHASPIDIFLIMWLTPTGTVGIAKKEVSSFLLALEVLWGKCRLVLNLVGVVWHIKICLGKCITQIVWYPLFGQLYVLASHLRIDRSNPTAAIESMKEVNLLIEILIFFPGKMLFSALLTRECLTIRQPVLLLRTTCLWSSFLRAPGLKMGASSHSKRFSPNLGYVLMSALAVCMIRMLWVEKQ